MNIKLRLEQPEDYKEVENLTREAFWNVHVPGCDEHYLIHIIRDCEAFIPELDYVAVLDNKIVGNIVYTEAKIVDDNNNEHTVLSFGPLSVLQEYQKQGLGKALIEHTKDIARNMGYKAILIYGDPSYYCRFGFIPAEKYNILTSDGMYHTALQVYELYNGSLKSVSGRFFEDNIYQLNKQLSEKFDSTFPQKEKFETESQKKFLKLLSMCQKP